MKTTKLLNCPKIEKAEKTKIVGVLLGVKPVAPHVTHISICDEQNKTIELIIDEGEETISKYINKKVRITYLESQSEVKKIITFLSDEMAKMIEKNNFKGLSLNKGQLENVAEKISSLSSEPQPFDASNYRKKLYATSFEEIEDIFTLLKDKYSPENQRIIQSLIDQYKNAADKSIRERIYKQLYSLYLNFSPRALRLVNLDVNKWSESVREEYGFDELIDTLGKAFNAYKINNKAPRLLIQINDEVEDVLCPILSSLKLDIANIEASSLSELNILGSSAGYDNTMPGVVLPAVCENDITILKNIDAMPTERCQMLQPLVEGHFNCEMYSNSIDVRSKILVFTCRSDDIGLSMDSFDFYVKIGAPNDKEKKNFLLRYLKEKNCTIDISSADSIVSGLSTLKAVKKLADGLVLKSAEDEKNRSSHYLSEEQVNSVLSILEKKKSDLLKRYVETVPEIEEKLLFCREQLVFPEKTDDLLTEYKKCSVPPKYNGSGARTREVIREEILFFGNIAKANSEREQYSFAKCDIPCMQRVVADIETAFNAKQNVALIGAPGTGKTMISEWVAKTINIPLIKIHCNENMEKIDDLITELMKARKKLTSLEVIVMIDEIDKGKRPNYFLHLIDGQVPYSQEQHLFFDTSQMHFIFTGNRETAETTCLLSRVMKLNLLPYSLKEKVSIGQYLLKKANNNLASDMDITISNENLRFAISEYTTCEAGIRGTKKLIEKIVVKARDFCQEKRPIKITKKEILLILGAPKKRVCYCSQKVGETTILGAQGMGNGVADKILCIPNRYSNLKTGNLDVESRESVENTLFAAGLVFKTDINTKYRIQVGDSTRKSGPSAGLPLFLAIASSILNMPIKEIASTGEVFLDGSIYPIGSLFEKLIAAEMNGIKKVLIPKINYYENKEIIEEKFGENLEIVPVSNVEEALDKAFGKCWREYEKEHKK